MTKAEKQKTRVGKRRGAWYVLWPTWLQYQFGESYRQALSYEDAIDMARKIPPLMWVYYRRRCIE